jgi:hypothetical protein
VSPQLEELTEQTIETILMVLKEVELLPQDEKEEFWKGFSPEQAKMLRDIQLIQSIKTNLPGVTSIRFQSEEDPEDGHTYDLNLYPNS